MRVKILAVIFVAATAVHGAAITSASELATFLGAPGIIYSFSGFSVPDATSFAVDCTEVTLTSICDGQGPGLVPQGLAFTFGSGGGQWDGLGYDGSTSEEILSGSSPSTLLTISFITPANGFALDLRAFPGYPATAMVTVFALDDTTVIGTISGINLPSTGASVFEGWDDSSGIGKVELTQTGEDWSPIVDFLEYGIKRTSTEGVVPEPGPLVCVGLGLAAIAIRRLRRRGYVWARLRKRGTVLIEDADPRFLTP
jgi:hypothetical protein